MKGRERAYGSLWTMLIAKETLIPVWVAVSVLFAAPAVMALVMEPAQLVGMVDAITPPHPECPLCGMTRGYVEMAHGNAATAMVWNAGAPFLFLAGIINGVAVCVYLVCVCAKSRRKTRSAE